MKYLPELVVGAVILIVGGYVGWAGVLIDSHVVRIRAPMPNDTTAWCREECIYLSFEGITTINSAPKTVADHRANGSDCPRFRRQASVALLP